MGGGDEPGRADLLPSHDRAGPGGLCVVLVEDHEIARRGLSEMLKALPVVHDVHPVDSTDAARRLLLGGEPVDVILLTSDAGETDVRGLMSEAPDGARVVVLIRNIDPACLDGAARLPASGFLMEQDITIDTLGDALVATTNGAGPMPPALAKHLLAVARKRGSPGSAPSLTGREHQVLELLIEGFSNKEIARRLGVSEHGAKRHVGNVLAKLNAPNRTHAAARAIRERL